MVILIQILVFFGVFVLRRRRLLGKHLKVNGEGNRLMHTSRNKYRSVKSRSLGLTHKNPLPFIVRRERWYDRWLKSVGLAYEVEMNDQAIDDKWFFVTDYPKDLERFIRSKDFQESLQLLCSRNIASLHATSERIWCVLGQELDRGEDEYEDYYDALTTISQKLSETKTTADYVGKYRNCQPFALAVLALHLTIFVTALVGVFSAVFDNNRIVDLWGHIGLSAAIAVPIIIAWGLILAHYFKGTSWVGWVLVDFLISGVVGVLLLSFALTRQANIELDVTDAAINGAPIIAKECALVCRSSGRRSRSRTYELTPQQCDAAMRAAVEREYQEAHSRCRNSSAFTYTLTLQSWDETKKPFTFAAKQQMYDAAMVGDVMRVPVRDGYLGMSWVATGDIEPLGKRY